MIKEPTPLCLALAVIASTLASSDAPAQIRASERGSVSQTVDGTTIEVDYSRPQARGREDLFGGEVPWGKVWTPGANWATTIGVDREITINGHQLQPGTYSVWFQVQPEEWTVILDPEPRRFHLLAPEQSEDQVRFSVIPESSSHTEVLTWSFPEIRPTGTTLRFAWADRSVSFDIGVKSTQKLTVAPEVAERLVGSYLLETGPFLGNQTVDFEITYEDGHLVGHWPSPPTPRLDRFWLVPLGAGMYHPGELDDGELFDIVTDAVFEFTPLEGRATGFELRGIRDELWGTAERQ